MPFHPATTDLSLGGGVQITVELEDNGLLFPADQRYTLRYGIR